MIRKNILLFFLLILIQCVNIFPDNYNYAVVKWGKLELGFYKNEIFQKYLNSYKEINANIIAGYGFDGKINRIIKHAGYKVKMIEYFNHEKKLIAKSIYNWNENGYVKKYYDCQDGDYTLKVNFKEDNFIYELKSLHPKIAKRIIEGDLELKSVLYTFYDDKDNKLLEYRVETGLNGKDGVIERHNINEYIGTKNHGVAYEVIKTPEGIVEKDYLNFRLKDNDYVHRKDGKEYNDDLTGEIVVRDYLVDNVSEYYIAEYEASKTYTLVFDDMVYLYDISYDVEGYDVYSVASCSISLSLYPTKVSRYLKFTNSKSLRYQICYYMVARNEFKYFSMSPNENMQEEGELMKYVSPEGQK